ncbi:class IV lanthionine synthetase LanL [Kitasatospora sp. NPDC051853]|uniref:class IV lanthionine synthetase LanL n=1 Tax=Kitasatospora sp. NPDC051853 TaxID=3364058 RepID=UPI0037A3D984
MGGQVDPRGRGEGAPGYEAHLLEDLARAAAGRAGAEDWLLRGDDGFWFRAEPAGHVGRRQGWKLHVSATPLSAAVVLARSLPVLFGQGCAFKFARTLEHVSSLVSTRCARGSGGKFLTAYPDDDEQFRTVAGLLHAATLGLPGPAVLSDRPYLPGSQVYYRYGAFRGLRRMTNDGTFDTLLEGPDGEPVRDSRRAWFSPPAWAPSPFPASEAAPAAATRPEVLLLQGRYAVRRALQHANRGGVYLADDRVGGGQVVIKQARPHVGSSLAGTDAQDALRNEARMLDLLAEGGVTPRKVEVFERSGSLFLVEEYIEGRDLDRWARERLLPEADAGPEPEQARELALRLVDLVDAVHRRGLVLRDLKPGNLMMTSGGELRLIDLEHVRKAGEVAPNAYTLGFAPPEQIAAARYGPVLGPTADLYALGATLFHLLTGVAPLLPEDDAPARPGDLRVRRLAEAAAGRNPALRALAAPVLGLLAEDPERRWDLDRVRAGLTVPLSGLTVPQGGVTVPPGGEPVPGAAPAPVPLPGPEPDRALRDGLDHLVATADFDDREAIWRSGAFGATTDRCNVQHGAAGVLAVLTLAAEQGHDPEPVRRTADWLRARIRTVPRRLPGLYFGVSGTALALHRAGRLLDDAALQREALDLADEVPTDWPNPDVCHGLAGAGLAALQLWRAAGDERSADRVRRCAEALAATVERSAGGVMWTIPKGFDSELAGLAQYGFGHGLAGIGTFLLAAGTETGEESWLELARAAGETLAAVAAPDGRTVSWPAEPGRRPDLGQPMALHWCSGVSGVGTFLVRLWSATGDERFADLARRAGHTVRHNRWQSSSAACHGLAGSGELLLDLAEAFPDEDHRAGAREVVEAMLVRDTLRDGRLVTTDESMMDVVADYGTGLSGALALLLRLRDGGPRLWLPANQPAGVAR